MLVGAALYWGEGAQRFKDGQYGLTEFSNSSPEMVKVFMTFARTILKVGDELFRPFVHIYPNLDSAKAITFWAKITNLPEDMFCAYSLVSGSSKRKRPINFLPYGTLKMRIKGRKYFYKIRGYIDGIIKALA